MSTFQLPAAELALPMAYLRDHSAADLLSRAAGANRAACLDDGWRAADLEPTPTATAIIAAAPMRRPARLDAAKVITSLRYNSSSRRAAFLTDADDAALIALLARIMSGVTAWDASRIADDDERYHTLRMLDLVGRAGAAA